MRLKHAGAALVAFALCYLGAGTPSITLLFNAEVISDGLTLKAITYHWANHFDRAIPEAELLASRFYVLVFAAISALAAFFVLKANRDTRSFAFALSWAAAVLLVLIWAQVRAFYTVG